ncbi:MAG: hypothetical protein ABIN35_04930 [candidate division WOR-3 bacterium]
MKNFLKQQRKKSKGIFLITILFLISVEGCIYSFVKGSLPFDKIVLEKIENRTYYLDFEEKFYNKIFEIFPVYANVKIVQTKENDSLNITIKDYSKKVYEYNDDGNIKSYKYSLATEYQISNLRENILTEKIFSTTFSEEECKDSLVVMNLKNFIDRIRKEF